MRNSEHILRTLDAQLDGPLSIRLHLLGGAALDLVYDIPRFSEDVDLMCTLGEGQAFDDPALQDALDRANEVLEADGLYLTHIFDESGLVHTRDWVQRLVAPPPGAPAFENFGYDAVSAEDIILSKITRLDEKDWMDIKALMTSRGISKDAIDALVEHVLVPPVWQEAWQNGMRRWQGASAY